MSFPTHNESIAYRKGLRKIKRDEVLPPGTHVILPTGREGVVIRQIGFYSKRDGVTRLLIAYVDKEEGRVQLSPKYLKVIEWTRKLSPLP